MRNRVKALPGYRRNVVRQWMARAGSGMMGTIWFLSSAWGQAGLAWLFAALTAALIPLARYRGCGALRRERDALKAEIDERFNSCQDQLTVLPKVSIDHADGEEPDRCTVQVGYYFKNTSTEPICAELLFAHSEIAGFTHKDFWPGQPTVILPDKEWHYLSDPINGLPRSAIKHGTFIFAMFYGHASGGPRYGWRNALVLNFVMDDELRYPCTATVQVGERPV